MTNTISDGVIPISQHISSASQWYELDHPVSQKVFKKRSLTDIDPEKELAPPITATVIENDISQSKGTSKPSFHQITVEKPQARFTT